MYMYICSLYVYVYVYVYIRIYMHVYRPKIKTNQRLGTRIKEVLMLAHCCFPNAPCNLSR